MRTPLFVLFILAALFAWQDSANAQGSTCATAVPAVVGTNVTPLFDGNVGFVGPSCTGQLGDAAATDAYWFSFTPAASGSFTVSSCASTQDTRVNIYSGSCGALSCITGSDDDCGLQSEVDVSLTGGETYFIVWDDRWASGDDGFSWTLAAAAPPPSNDDCADATVVAIPSSSTGNTSDATDSNPGSCENAADGSGGGLWYAIEGNGDSIEVSTCNAATSYDTQLALFDGTCGALNCLEGNDDASNDGFSCGFSGLRSIIQFLSVPGTTYYVYIDGFGAGEGAFQLDVTSIWTAPPPPPPPVAVPTMGQWGLMILSLIMLSLGAVFVSRRKAVLAGTTVSMSDNKIPFNKATYPKVLLACLVAVAAIFAIAMAFGYELTNADIPGALLATPVLAYLVHLFTGKKVD